MRIRISYGFLGAGMFAVLSWTALAAQAQARGDLDIPAQPLADSLRSVGSQTSTNILFDPPLVAGRRAPALKGGMTSEQALSRLLAGTGIHHQFLNEKTVVLAALQGESARYVASADFTVAAASAAPLADTAATGEGKSSGSSESFRVAQVDRRTAANPAEVAGRSAGLEEIIVTAQKREESLSRVPGAVVAVSGENLIEAGIVDVRNLDSAVAGVMFNSTGTIININVRGIGSTQYSPLGGPVVGVNLDGVPIEGSTAANAAFFDVQRVEVLKGPQGTLYGKNATAGVMNIVTKRPELGRFGGSADVELGNYDARRVEGALNVPVGDAAAFRFAGLYRERDGFMSNGYNDADEYGVRAHALLEPSDAFSLLLSGDFFHQGGRGMTDVPLPYGSRGTNANDPWDQFYFPDTSDAYQDNDYWGIHAELNADLGFAQLVVVPSYRKVNREEVVFRTAYRGYTKDTDRQTSAEARLSGEVGPVRWLFGGYWFDSERRYNGDFYQPGLYANAPTTGACTGGVGVGQWRYLDGNCVGLNGLRSVIPQESEAVFVNLAYSITERIRATVGLRYSHDTRGTDPAIAYTVNPFPAAGTPVVPPAQPVFPSLSDPSVSIKSTTAEVSFSNTSYKAGLEFDLADATMLYANIATGYKAGGVNETGTPYEPEELTSYDAGVRSRLLNDSLSVHLNGFYWDYKNHQEAGIFFNPAFGGIAWQIANIPKGTLYGADLELQWRATQADSFDVQVAYLRSDTGPLDLYSGATRYVTSGHEFVTSPEWTVNFGYGHAFNFGGWTLEPKVQTHIVTSYNNNVRFNDATRQAGYHKTDFNLTLRPQDGDWYVGAFVRNIEDEAVLVSGATAPGLPLTYWGMVGDPRTYGVRAGVKF